MSTFAVFGMTAAAALADARKKTKTTKPSGKAGRPPLDLTLAEWEEAVQRNVEAIMAGEKVKQLSVLYDTPRHAQQFIDLARRAGKCRDLRIRVKAVLTDNEGQPVLHKKTKAPMIGWSDYVPGRLGDWSTLTSSQRKLTYTPGTGSCQLSLCGASQ